MNLNDNVVYSRVRLGSRRQLHPGLSRSLFRYHDRLHRPALDVWDFAIFKVPVQMSENGMAKLDRPMSIGYGVDAIHLPYNSQQGGTAHKRADPYMMRIDRWSPLAWK